MTKLLEKLINMKDVTIIAATAVVGVTATGAYCLMMGVGKAMFSESKNVLEDAGKYTMQKFKKSIKYTLPISVGIGYAVSKGFKFK
jgi:hypothetical protein